MPHLLFTYANRREAFLPELGQEDERNSELLFPGMQEQRFLVHNISFTTQEKLAYWLRLLRDELEWFHYSGHAEQDGLWLEDRDARAEGLIELLRKCPRLKGVVLNGCCTLEQARALVDAGIPLVIGTSVPVGDASARIFSNTFYEELMRGADVPTAHETAIAAVKLGQTVPELIRGLAPQQAAGPCWCLLGEDTAYHLPQEPEPIPRFDFEPNSLLIEELFSALAHYAPEVQVLHDIATSGKTVSFAKRRMAIINSLPAPIAEQLRKLMVPVTEENQGYNRISEARLQQLIATFNTAMEILVFTLLAQLWEVLQDDAERRLPADLRAEISSFLSLDETSRATYPYLFFVRQLRLWLAEQDVPFFVEELAPLAEIFAADDSAFTTACAQLESLRLQLYRYALPAAAIPRRCLEGEQALATVCGQLGFLARYTLATVKTIDVQKYKHQQEATFKHTLVRLIDLLGDLEETPQHLPSFLDNRSVLLIKEYEEVREGEPPPFLNLSPFILDQNAFIEHQEVSQVHFLRQYAAEEQRLYYQYVFKPTDKAWELGAFEKEPLNAVYEQFAAFLCLLNPEKDQVA